MKMQKRKFRIGELATHLSVEKFVIRFWEKEFGFKTTRSTGGQRFYEENDLNRFKLIKKLLYEDGFTIAGAKKQLEQDEPKIIASKKTSFELSEHSDQLEQKTPHNAHLIEEILQLRKRLAQLQKLL